MADVISMELDIPSPTGLIVFYVGTGTRPDVRVQLVNTPERAIWKNFIPVHGLR